MNNRNIIFGAILSVLACFVLLPQMRAAPENPEVPDVFSGSNTWDGFRALNAGKFNNTFSTADGWQACLLQTDALNNAGFGAGALALGNASNNCGFGAGAATFNTAGAVNAFGAFALFNNGGFFNNAHGREALFNNTTGSQNNAMGDLAMLNNTEGSLNTAIGDDALDSNTTGGSNTAVGDEAGANITTGSNNTCVGKSAGLGISTADNQVAIGVAAAGPFANISNTCFIRSIWNQPVSNGASQRDVFVDSNNVLGEAVSSRRFKHDIQPMDNASEALLKLKPVTFKYKSDQSGTTQYGLIAEEVAEVAPNLATYGNDGKVQSIKYTQINALLLNEFLKEHKKVDEQQATISALKNEVQTVVAQLKDQAAQIQKVSAQLEVSKPAAKVVVNKP